MQNPEITSQLLAGFAATISILYAGFTMAWPSPSLAKLLAEDSHIPITLDQGSWIVSSVMIGCTFGPLIGGAIVDRCGRKLSLLFTVIPCSSSYILIGLAQSYWLLIVARFICGLGVGATVTIMPMYLGEIAEDRIRGALGTMYSLMLNIGVLLAYCVGPWVSFTTLACLGGALPLIFGIIFVWMPESPYFLIMKDKHDRAERSLSWLRGTTCVSEELKKIQETVELERKNISSITELVVVPGNRKAMILVLALGAAQQFSGINAILAYSSLIFEASGSTLDSSISVIIIGVVQLLSGLLTTFTVDLAGRRPLFLISGCGTFLFLGGKGLYFYLQAINADVSTISWLPVTAIIGYIVLYSIGLAGVPQIVLSEIFPCNVKAGAAMVYTSGVSAIGIVVTKIYQVVADEYGIHASFWGFAVITILLTSSLYFILPETKQRSFRSIQDELHKTTKS